MIIYFVSLNKEIPITNKGELMTNTPILWFVLVFSNLVTTSQDPEARLVVCEQIKSSGTASLGNKIKEVARKRREDFHLSCETDRMLPDYYKNQEELERKCTKLLRAAEVAENAACAAQIDEKMVAKIFDCK